MFIAPDCLTSKQGHEEGVCYYRNAKEHAEILACFVEALVIEMRAGYSETRSS